MWLLSVVVCSSVDVSWIKKDIDTRVPPCVFPTIHEGSLRGDTNSPFKLTQVNSSQPRPSHTGSYFGSRTLSQRSSFFKRNSLLATGETDDCGVAEWGRARRKHDFHHKSTRAARGTRGGEGGKCITSLKARIMENLRKKKSKRPSSTTRTAHAPSNVHLREGILTHPSLIPL